MKPRRGSTRYVRASVRSPLRNSPPVMALLCGMFSDSQRGSRRELPAYQSMPEWLEVAFLGFS